MKKVEFTEMRAVTAGGFSDTFFNSFFSWSFNEDAGKFFAAIRSFILGGVLGVSLEEIDLAGFGQKPYTFKNVVVAFKGFNGGGFKIPIIKIIDALDAFQIRS